MAQGDPGAPLGRELGLAAVLTGIKRLGIRNHVWLTADVHYTAAHHYSPDRAAYQDFDPFWEFVSGPLNAGAFGPNKLEGTFGPVADFVAAPPAANTSPAAGFQFFGEVEIDARSKQLSVTLRDVEGAGIYTPDLGPAASLGGVEKQPHEDAGVGHGSGRPAGCRLDDGPLVHQRKPATQHSGVGMTRGGGQGGVAVTHPGLLRPDRLQGGR